MNPNRVEDGGDFLGTFDTISDLKAIATVPSNWQFANIRHPRTLSGPPEFTSERAEAYRWDSTSTAPDDVTATLAIPPPPVGAYPGPDPRRPFVIAITANGSNPGRFVWWQGGDGNSAPPMTYFDPGAAY